MEEAIKQIGERLKGLREALDISVQEMAETCGISEEKYLKMELVRVSCQLVNCIRSLISMMFLWMLCVW